MHRLLVFAIFLSMLSEAKDLNRPIEGGKAAPRDTYLLDIKKISTTTFSCTTTKVSNTFFITAAHCVWSIKEGKETLSVGQNLDSIGKVKKVHINPDYKKLSSNVSIRDRVPFDVALIEIEEKYTTRLPTSYPKLISSDSKFNQREKMFFAGYGKTKIIWEGKEYTSLDETSYLQKAENCWIQQDGETELKELIKLENGLSLNIRAKRTHLISNGQETIETYDKGIGLPGDSGSPSIELDKYGNYVITGILSNMSPSIEKISASLKIKRDGNPEMQVEMKDFPENWGLASKLDSEFEEIKKILEKHNLTDKNGNLLPGVTIERAYTRTAENQFSDLSNNSNQEFLNTHLKLKKDKPLN